MEIILGIVAIFIITFVVTLSPKHTFTRDNPTSKQPIDKVLERGRDGRKI